MEKMKSFDYYEFAGILAPGSVTLLAMFLLFPDTQSSFLIQDVTIGGLGLFVILAYVAGHITQAVANVFEEPGWRMLGGWPTDWVRTKKRRLLSDVQIQALQEQLPAKLGINDPINLEQVPGREWAAIVRQINAAVENQSSSTRVGVFNANYGLHRGLAFALMIAAIVTSFSGASQWPIAVMTLVGSLLTFYRTYRFGRYYARELFIQFLDLPLTMEERRQKAMDEG
jgi:hypothetical protein